MELRRRSGHLGRRGGGGRAGHPGQLRRGYRQLLGARQRGFANAAFRAYRNFDGASAAIGDTSIHAASSDVPTATVYASTDSSNPGRVVTVLINKAASAKTAGITIAHSSSFASLSVYTLTSASANVVAGSAVPAVAQNAFLYTMPALSVSVLVANGERLAP
jgi:mannan endo-1,4-beta-mannosidase